MSKSIPHLELRRTGFFWRRRVPTAILPRYQTSFFCFPLKTHVLREAAAVASRITAISDICFRAEIDVPPEVMTRLLVTYARLEIETADRLRALLGPQTREAAEASLALETSIRASLRDAIFLCERDPAFRAIESTARHLGIDLVGEDEDLPILADKMLRLMIELSEERERRARGHFSDSQPYLALALSGENPSTSLPKTSSTALHAPAGLELNAPAKPITTPKHTAAPDTRRSAVLSSNEPDEAAPALDQAAEQSDVFDATVDLQEPADAPSPVLFDNGTVSLAFAERSTEQPCDEPTILELFDTWFDYRARGGLADAEYEYIDSNLGETFLRNADNERSTRRILEDFFGTKRISDIKKADWQTFVNFLSEIPKNHGKSPKDRHISLKEVIRKANAKDNPILAKAQKAADDRNRKAGRKLIKVQRSDIEGLTPRIAARTVQRHQQTLASALDHAVEQGLIPGHDFRGFVLKDKSIALMKSKQADTTRKLWGSEFETLLSTAHWNSPKTAIDDALYWAPLIARMQGMRSEEILQLYTANIRTMDGIVFFDILKGTGQSLKSNNARRMIPIHSQLIELGFMDLVERQRLKGERRLFPKAKRCKSAKLSYTANFTKRFAYYRNTRDVYDPLMDFHALRTTFNTDAVTARMPDTARRYIMGHNNPDVGITNYLPEGFPLATLKEFIEQKRFDLSKVTKRFAKVDQRPNGPVLAVSNLLPLPRGKRRKAVDCH